MLSQQCKLTLAESKFGRVMLHLLCLFRGGKWHFHCASIRRGLCEKQKKAKDTKMPALNLIHKQSRAGGNLLKN